MSYPSPQVPSPPQQGFVPPPSGIVPPLAPAPTPPTPTGSEPSLDQPWPGIPYKQAWIRFWKKGATFTGRASRSEYWKIYFTLLVPALIQMVMGIIAEIRVFSSLDSSLSCVASGNNFCPTVSPFAEFSGVFGKVYLIWTIIYWLIVLACIVPSLALGWRRMHDTNKAGPFVLIPIAGDIIFAAGAPHPAGIRFDEGARPYGYGYGYGYGFPGGWYPPGTYPPPAPNQMGAGGPWGSPPVSGAWVPPPAPGSYYPPVTPGGVYPPADASYGAPLVGDPLASLRGFGSPYGSQPGVSQPVPPPPAPVVGIPGETPAAPEQLPVPEPAVPDDFSPESVESPASLGESEEFAPPSVETVSGQESVSADPVATLSPVEFEPGAATAGEGESVSAEMDSVPTSEGVEPSEEAENESVPASAETELVSAEPVSSSPEPVSVEPEFTFAPAGAGSGATGVAPVGVTAADFDEQTPTDDAPETAFSPVSDGEHPVSSPPLSTVAETTEIPYLTAFPGSPAKAPGFPTPPESSASSVAPSSAFYPAGGEEDGDATTRITGPSIPGSRGWGASEADDAAPSQLVWVLNLDEDREIPVTGKVVLGRSPQLAGDLAGATAVSIKDISLSASKTHAFFELRDSALFVTDLGSTNGSRITDSDGVETMLAARTEYRVEPGSIVRLGDYAIGITQRAE